MEELSDRIIRKLRNRSNEAVTSLEFVAAEIEEAADGGNDDPLFVAF